MTNTLTFITAFYKIYDDINESYINNFLELSKTGYNIILFLDPQLIKYTQKLNRSNVTIIDDIQFVNNDDRPLPKFRDIKKDTREYISLMNRKLDFMVISLPFVKTPNIAWIDFGITKIFKNIEQTLEKLQYINIPFDKVLIPGCIPRKQECNVDHVHWRFCGGIFFGSTSVIEKFHTYSKEIRTDVLTWEVNVWALVEQKYPHFFQWYKGDHNDTIFDFPRKKKIIAIIMIKNESAIIKRCINRAILIADAICISDTGSTDNTLKILEEEIITHSLIPIKICNHEWVNFGHNRTLSFNSAQEYCNILGWNPEDTYGLLLDADMNLEVKQTFQKNNLVENGYNIMQRTKSLEYYNTRFVKMSYPWKCVGVTHEYWDGTKTEKLETIYINDIGDGGCKTDKFDRDERLLKEGLEKDPENSRYMFYLAQTLKNQTKIDEAIEMYKRRIKAGGWYEEVWYSMYQISCLYFEKNNLIDMEYWGLKAYEYNKNRSENIYYLCRCFRIKSQYFKAWHYLKLGKSIPKGKEVLFIENAVYEHLFDYEKTLLNYYVQPDSNNNMFDIITYHNNISENTYSNLKFYVKPIKNKNVRTLNFKNVDDFFPSSTSILKTNDTYLLNIRYVNYRIQSNGTYVMSKNGKLNRDNDVITRNFSMIVDKKFNPLSCMNEMIPNFLPTKNSNIKGLEDIRLFQDGQQTKFIAASKEYSHDGKIRQIIGIYDYTRSVISDCISIKTSASCEKNWIPLPTSNTFIYMWHPYQIYKQNEDTISIIKKQDTPRFFRHIRGSSNVVEYKNKLYTLTHNVIYSTPRKYYHQLVCLNNNTYLIECYTYPFYFINNAIEYCLGIEIKDDILLAIISQNDSDPVLIEIDFKVFNFISA